MTQPKNTNFKKEPEKLGYRTPDKFRADQFNPNSTRFRPLNPNQVRRPLAVRTRSFGGHR